MKRFLTILALFISMVLFAAPTIFRETLLPGAPESPEWYQPFSFTAPQAAAAGTLAFWLYAEDWSESDKSVFCVASAGDRKKTSAPGFDIYRNPDGTLRLLWFNHIADKELGEVNMRNVRPGADHWVHLAFTWQNAANGSSMIRFYRNGKEAGAHWNKFSWKPEEFPATWQLNNSPGWAKSRSTSRIGIGKVVMETRALSPKELENLAQAFSGTQSIHRQGFPPGHGEHAHWSTRSGIALDHDHRVHRRDGEGAEGDAAS